jgi:hypothetical protein
VSEGAAARETTRCGAQHFSEPSRAGQIPSVYITARLPLAKVMGIACIGWGILLLGSMGCKNYGQMLAIRFLLGLIEAPLVPSLVSYTALFYTKKEGTARTLIWGAMQVSEPRRGAMLTPGRVLPRLQPRGVRSRTRPERRIEAVGLDLPRVGLALRCARTGLAALDAGHSDEGPVPFRRGEGGGDRAGRREHDGHKGAHL